MINVVARFGFVVVVLLALVGVFSAVTRFAATMDFLVNPPESLDPARDVDPAPGFNERYHAHPYLTLLHVTAGIVFMVLGPLQFVGAIRSRWIGFHRWCGRAFLIASLLSVVTALVIVPVLPMFGTFTASVAVVVASAVFLIALVQGYRHIRRFEIAEHRECMIRVLAIGLGISTFRIMIPFLIGLFDVSFSEAWDAVAWLGFVVNAGVAEVWIHVTRGRAVTLTRASSSARRPTRTIPTVAISDAGALRVDQ